MGRGATPATSAEVLYGKTRPRNQKLAILRDRSDQELKILHALNLMGAPRIHERMGSPTPGNLTRYLEYERAGRGGIGINMRDVRANEETLQALADAGLVDVDKRDSPLSYVYQINDLGLKVDSISPECHWVF